MIIKAVEELARALCEVSPSGTCDGLSIVLPGTQWRALECEMLTRRSLSRLGDHPPPETEPTEFRLYTSGGEVTIRKASE